MKKLSVLFAALTVLLGNTALADSTGKGSYAGRNSGSDGFQWGIAIGAAAAIGTVVGLTVATAASSPVSYSASK